MKNLLIAIGLMVVGAISLPLWYPDVYKQEATSSSVVNKTMTSDSPTVTKVPAIDPLDELCGPGLAKLVADAKVALAKKDYKTAYDSLDRCNVRLVKGTDAYETHIKAAQAFAKWTDQMQAAQERAEKARKKKEGVQLGMSQQDVLDSSWGRPTDVNRTIGKWGTHEQWVYRGGYLYFENGVLTSIQN